MNYDYDRRVASTTSQILSLIVKKVLDGRSVYALVMAYKDEQRETWEEEDDGSDPEPASQSEEKAWRTRVFGILHTEREIERVMSEAYVRTYRHYLKHPLSKQEALQVFEFPPPGFPIEEVPRDIVIAVATALARRDAADANALRDMAIQRGLV